MKQSYYEILGVSEKADTAEIKRAYRAAVKKYHPDLHQNASESEKAEFTHKTGEINEAYDVLSDSRRRAQYDSSLHNNAYNGNAYNGAYQGNYSNTEYSSYYSNSDFADFWEEINKVRSNYYEEELNRRRRQSAYYKSTPKTSQFNFSLSSLFAPIALLLFLMIIFWRFILFFLVFWLAMKLFSFALRTVTR